MASHYAADFEAMVGELRRRGFTFDVLAKQLDIPVSSLKEYASGAATPKHPSGERIITLYCGVALVERTRIPTIALAVSAAKAR